MNILLKKYKSILTTQKVYIILLGVCYVLGIVLGFVFFGEQEKLLFGDNSVEFIVITIGKDGSAIKLFLARFVNSLSLFIFFGLSGLVVFLVPVHFIIIIYRGYVLSASAIIFFTKFGFTGIVVFLFAILIQNLVTTISLICFSSFAFNERLGAKKCGKTNYQFYLITLGVAFVISVLANLVEMLMLLCVLRPLNFYF